MLPLLRQAAKQEHADNSPPVGVMNISSRTASFQDNSMGKLYGSRLSKVCVFYFLLTGVTLFLMDCYFYYLNIILIFTSRLL